MLQWVPIGDGPEIDDNGFGLQNFFLSAVLHLFRVDVRQRGSFCLAYGADWTLKREKSFVRFETVVA